ncbi:MAG: hypothetical protein ACI4SS_04165 [Clostridia bacterium]
MANVKRCEKLAFMRVDGKYYRMTNFTEISTSKNPKEYSRQYVDEEFERSSIVGYSPSVSYSFDYDRDNSVHEHINKITDEELLADDAVVEIVMVDVENPAGVNQGISREWSVIPDSEGDSTDAYTYSGSFKSCGEVKKVSAVSTDNWKTITVE